MPLRALAPFAILGTVIAVASTTAVVSSVRPVATTASARPSATADGSRTTPALSATGRLTYWRDGRLWVSDLDGSLRHSLAATPDPRRISLTRWAVDGSAVAFVDSSLSLSVVRLDGSTVTVDLPIDLRNFGYRIADLRWSPSARAVAATLLRPGDGRADAFVVDLTVARPAWSRLTTLGDLFLGDWVSDDELLGYTAGGAVVVVSARALNGVRLISSVPGVSPVLGPNGRVYYVAGDVPRLRDPALPFVSASGASIWSTTVDGEDTRRETGWTLDEIRLDAVLAGGRFLAHVGPGQIAQVTSTGEVVPLPPVAGVFERVRVAGDGRTAYGFAGERILRTDLARAAAPGGAGSVSVFLDGVGGGDVWFPSATPGRAAVVSRVGDTTLVFPVGAHLWQLEDGAPTLLRPAPATRRSLPARPRWSPSGDRLLVIEQAGSVASATTLAAFLLDRDGDAVRLEGTQGAARSAAWSPDGRRLAVVVDTRGLSGTAGDATLEVRFFDASGRPSGAAVEGREVAWTTRGLLVMRERDGVRRIERLASEDAAKATTVAVASDLAADPRAKEPGGALDDVMVLSSLDAPVGGGFASAQLRTTGVALTRSYLVVVDGDGHPVRYVRDENVTDVAWSPKDDLIGYTVDAGTPGQRAAVWTADGRLVTATSGRFGGWSPDGSSVYVSRADGLFALPLAGGDPARVGIGGAPIAAAPR